MRDLSAFKRFLKKERRASGTIDAHLKAVKQFIDYMAASNGTSDIDAATPAIITQFVDEKSQEGQSAKSLLWSLHNYYRYSQSKQLHDHALALRMKAMEKEKSRRATPKLATMAGGSETAVAALRDRDILTAKALIACAARSADRAILAKECGVSQQKIDDLAFFADLSRITDIKGKRARLLLDGGIRTVADLREWEPQLLQAHLAHVVGTGSIVKRPPTLIETRYWVKQAIELPDVVELS